MPKKMLVLTDDIQWRTIGLIDLPKELEFMGDMGLNRVRVTLEEVWTVSELPEKALVDRGMIFDTIGSLSSIGEKGLAVDFLAHIEEFWNRNPEALERGTITRNMLIEVIRMLTANGRKIHAIKLVRDYAHGAMNLKQAKMFVEQQPI